MSIEVAALLFTALGTIATLITAFSVQNSFKKTISISRDHIGGDKVGGDKITISSASDNNYTEIVSRRVIAVSRIFIALFIISLIYYIISPYIFSYQLYNALKRGDIKTINQSVAWEELRQDLKDSIKGLATAKFMSDQMDNKGKIDPFEYFTSLATPKIVGLFVDQYVDAYSIGMIITLVAKQKTANSLGTNDKAAAIDNSREFISDKDLSDLLSAVNYAFFISPRIFEIVIDLDSAGNPVTFVLRHDIDSWKLQRIVFSEKAIMVIVNTALKNLK